MLSLLFLHWRRVPPPAPQPLLRRWHDPCCVGARMQGFEGGVPILGGGAQASSEFR